MRWAAATASILLAGALATVVPACADLPAVPTGACGNGVVDPGEDCDTFAPGALSCRPAGASNACRLDCSKDATGKARACPAGWGCGSDAICRVPSGRFAAATEIVESGSSKLRSADVDGDGLADVIGTSPGDVLGRSSVRVHFFDHAARLAKTSTIPALLSGSSVGDVTGDGLADVVGVPGFFSGLMTFAGDRGRALLPNAYPALTVPQGSSIRVVAMRVVKEAQAGDQTLIFTSFPDPQTGALVSVLALTSDVTHPLLLLDRSADTLAGKVRTGAFAEGAPCEQIVVAFAAASSVAVFSPCRVHPDGTVGFNQVLPSGMPVVPPTIVSLPPGAAVGSGVVVADVDGDLHLDLIIDAGDHALVAYGDGKGDFSSLPGQKGAPFAAGPLALPKDGKQVVAFGAASSSATRYLISARAVFLLPWKDSAVCPGDPGDTAAACVLGRNLGALWTDAVIGDFNRDGLTDLVASSSGSNDLAFYSGSPSGVLNPSTVSTVGAVSQLTAGDFDGDLIDDVAFAEVGAHAGGQTPGDALEILFGRPAGPPDAPLFIGRFDRIEQIVRAHLGTLPKTAADLGVTSRSEDGTEETVAILSGNGDRVLLAPFGLQILAPPAPTLVGSAVATALGQVAGDPRLDAITVAFDSVATLQEISVFRFWITESQKHGRFAAPIASEPLPKSVQPFASPGEQVVFLRAGDLDGDGFDEIVYVGLDAAMAHESVLVIAETGGKGAITVRDPIALPKFVPPSGHVTLADVDGDGHLDLVALTRAVATDADLLADATEVSIFWGMAGGFDLARPTVIAPPGGLALLDLALLVHGAGKDVALASEESTFVAVRDGRAFTVSGSGVPGGTGLASGDVDGDGVEDLAVASGGAVRIFRGEAVKP